MAIVIPFAPQRRPEQVATCSLPRQTAAILFFTGVRYERASESRPPVAKVTANARPRKAAARKSPRRQPA